MKSAKFLTKHQKLVSTLKTQHSGELSCQKNNENGQEMMSKETNKVVDQLENIGYKVNAEKTQAVLFTKKTNLKEYNLTIKGEKVVTGPTAKYLGVILDKKLSFK